MSEGWGYPFGSRKYHYFRDTRSLCCKYGFYLAELRDPGITKESYSYCKKCNNILKRIVAKPPGG